MSDPREKALTDAYIEFVEETKYNRHFAGIPEQAVMESRLFLRLWDALQIHDINKAISDIRSIQMPDSITVTGGTLVPEGRAFVKGEEIVIIDGAGNHVPVPMILWCPACGSQHVDKEEEHKPDCMSLKIGPEPDATHCNCDRWTNPPHRSHLCAACGHVWRPSDVRTVGVAEIASQGSRDTPEPVRGRIGHLPTAQPDCMFVRCPSPTMCKEGCKHVKHLAELGR